MPNSNAYECFVPLTNFESQLASIKLAPGYAIRRISETERRTVKRYTIVWPKIAYGDFVMECTSTEQTPKQDFTLWATHAAERAVLVLRLYKEGMIGYNVVISISQVKTGRHLALHRRPWSSADVYESKQKYNISQDERQELQKFFTEFIGAPLGDLNLAARYFNKSYEETDTPPDSFVDLIIALESLYLKGESLELGYKLAMRMSHVLGKDPSARKRIFDKMKGAYKIRGKIVHGKKRPVIDSTMLLEIRKYARESLQIFIKHTACRDNLDKIILGVSSHP